MKYAIQLILFLLPMGIVCTILAASEPKEETGFVSLFDGVSLEHWVVGKGSEGHWRVVDGVIDYDGRSTASRNLDKQLWTRKWYTDFTFRCEWRFPGEVRVIESRDYLPVGGVATQPDGSPVRRAVSKAGDSGIFLRGWVKLQVNLGQLPVHNQSKLMGTGGIWGFFMDLSLPEETRVACRPAQNVDRPAGQWNEIEITLIGNRITVDSNGVTVIEQVELPRLPEAGPIGLQHHTLGPIVGAPLGETHEPVWIQFRNLRIKEY